MTPANGINLFNTYGEENSFTNGLFCLLELSAYERPRFVPSFLKLLGIESDKAVDPRFKVRVLRGIDAADAELRGSNCCLRFETKIRSGCLSHEQIKRRLRELGRCTGRLKRVVLLTPDDGSSRYIREICQKHQPRVLHLEWRDVYRFLSKEAARRGTFSAIVSQFLLRIEEQIQERDFAGVITKVVFDDHTQVRKDTYLREMKRGEWDAWHTPRRYRELDGTGRKLLLYEKGKGITAEVEIKEVIDDGRWRFKSRNVFARRPKLFTPAIPLKDLRTIRGFANFGRYRKDRSPYRNLTREQYSELIRLHSTASVGAR